MTQRRHALRRARALPALLVLAALASTACQDARQAPDAPSRVLVYSAVNPAGFRHTSIPTGVQFLQALGAAHGFGVDATEDPSTFSPGTLAGFRAAVFLNTNGDVLDDPQRAALQAYVEGGGGWLGVHSAADTEHAWPWYGTLLGGDAWFVIHPPIQAATVVAENLDHPAAAALPASFAFTDEWYNYLHDPRPFVTVLLSLDETSYAPGSGAMGASHPITWSHDVGQGRAFYTNMGHQEATYADPLFQALLLAGLRWVARLP